MLKTIYRLFLLACAVFIISGCSSNSTKEANNIIWDDIDADINILTSKKPNFTGLWVLNNEKSQNPHEELTQNMRKPDNAKGGRGKNGGGDGSHSGRGKGNADKQGKNYSGSTKNSRGFKALPQELHTLLTASETLELKHEEALFSILSKSGLDKVYTDFRSSVSSSNNPNQKVIIAGWEQNTLVVESTLSSGRLIQQFKLNTVSDELWIKTSILTPQLSKSVEYISVYERGEPENF